MTFAPNPPQRRSHVVFAGSRRGLLLLLVAMLLFIGVESFRGLGRWLVRPDVPAHAGAIVILSGGMPYRAEQAAVIYHAGDAPEVWITRPRSAAERLQEMGIHYVGEEDYNRQILLHAGVPDQAIQVLPDGIFDTADELTETARQLRRENKSSVLIVTSAEHTRRVRTLWHLLADKNEVGIVCESPQDPFDADHWWRNTRDAYSVVRELLGLTDAWLRLPVHAPEQ
jgi:uncharacterized SAM-binding protein YcdF (DUF218 family)